MEVLLQLSVCIYISIDSEFAATRTINSDNCVGQILQLVPIYTGSGMGSLATTDICDENTTLLSSGDLRILPPIFQIYGQRRSFAGQIATVKVFEDNGLVIEMVESAGNGRVLFIDGGGSTRCAVIGGLLVEQAMKMGWAGVVAYGCIRDVDDINGCNIGVRALATVPRRPTKDGIGKKHAPIYVAGIVIHDGEWLYADGDGILVSKQELAV